MFREMSLVISICLSVSGCGSLGSKTNEAAEALQEKGSLEVLKDASEDEYDPPKDGRVSDDQVQMYLAIKKREAELAKAAAENLTTQAQKAESAEKRGQKMESMWEGMKALGKAADFFTA